MGRPAKPGLDYSAIDCDFSRKPLSLQIRKKFGLEGLGVLYEVISWINEGKGCYVECQSLSDAAEQFATSRLFDINKCDWVESIFRFMLDVGFFDQAALDRDKVLTSEGIARRWYDAKKATWEGKKRPCPYELPESVREYIPSLEKNSTPKPQNFTPNTQEQTPNSQKSPPNCHKVKYSTNTKKQKKEKSSESFSTPNSPPNTPELPASQDPALFVRGARDDPHWEEVRLRIARMVYSEYLSADLVDAITAAAVSHWINVPQLRSWISEARDERELYRTSKAYAGKAKLWEVLRPRIEEVYLAHGMILPPCDNRRREPPPPPEANDDVGYDAATRAGRAVMAVT